MPRQFADDPADLPEDEREQRSRSSGFLDRWAPPQLATSTSLFAAYAFVLQATYLRRATDLTLFPDSAGLAARPRSRICLYTDSFTSFRGARHLRGVTITVLYMVCWHAQQPLRQPFVLTAWISEGVHFHVLLHPSIGSITTGTVEDRGRYS